MQSLRYLDKYREYQRLDTSIEEVSIYRDATILPSIVTIPVSSRCSLHSIALLLTTTAHCVTIKKTRHTKTYQTYSKHILLSDSKANGPSKGRGARKNFTPSRQASGRRFIWTSGIAILDTWNSIVIVAPVSGIAQHYFILPSYTGCGIKNDPTCFCQNVKFPPNLIIFGTQMGKTME